MTNWYALYVRSKHEFVTTGELSKKGIDVYLPSVQRWHQWRDRKKLVNSPLFPGYLFVNIPPEPEAFITVLKTRGAVTFITLDHIQPTPIAAAEIETLKLLTLSGEEIDVYPHLKEGGRVRVKRGPLAGAVGIIARKEERYMLLVNVTLLGRSVGVRLYPGDVEVD
ncbi:MAG: UpxY family transcription antiterminator [Nitrospirota bacterium]